MKKITEREASLLMANALRQIIEYYEENISNIVKEREEIAAKFDSRDAAGDSLQEDLAMWMDISRLNGAIESLELVAIPAMKDAIEMIEADDAKPESGLILPSHVR